MEVNLAGSLYEDGVYLPVKAEEISSDGNSK